MRKESHWNHYRLDYPKIDNENWQAWINLEGLNMTIKNTADKCEWAC